MGEEGQELWKAAWRRWPGAWKGIREQGPGRGSEQPRTQEGLGFLVRKEAPDTGRSANSGHGSLSTDRVQTFCTVLNRPHLD